MRVGSVSERGGGIVRVAEHLDRDPVSRPAVVDAALCALEGLREALQHLSFGLFPVAEAFPELVELRRRVARSLLQVPGDPHLGLEVSANVGRRAHPAPRHRRLAVELRDVHPAPDVHQI